MLIQLIGILLYPWMEDTPAGRALFSAFGLIVLGAALRMVRRSPAVNWVAWLLAALVLASSISSALLESQVLMVIGAGMEGAFYSYAAASLIWYMMEDRRATTDEFFAAGATFTLLAWAFAYIYAVCQALIPGSFSAQLNPEAARTWMELLFLSFTTLSGVGLGDIIPLTPMARALVMLEEFVGVMYIALVVSRLIGMSILGRR